MRVAINGFGRIGRTFYRAVRARGEDTAIDIVAVNDVLPLDQLAYLLEFDSVAGRLGASVAVCDGLLRIGDGELRVVRAATPADAPWRELGVDVVVESSRVFAAADKARAHLAAGAGTVVVTAPSDGADATFVVGVNHATFDPAVHRVVSNASCTTNCLAPMVKVLDEAFGVEDALMTTVHAYTSDQTLVDGAGRGLRDNRAAAQNVIPTTSGAARAIGLVLPDHAGRFDGGALRVPVADGSITDLTALVRGEVSVDAVNDAFRAAATTGPLAGVLDYSDRPIVSSDIVGSPASCTFDAPLTTVRGRLVKVFGWYDNEWGYSNRLVDLVEHIAAA